MTALCLALQFLSVAALGLFLGAMLTEGGVLVPWWQSLAPADFLAWYAANDRRLLGFFSPVTTGAALTAVAAAVGAVWMGQPGRWLAVTAAGLMLAAVATFFLYFETVNAGFAAAALRHAHSRQDEFVYVLAGCPTLVTDTGETPMSPGMCAGFKAGTGDGHHLVNRTGESVVFLEVGDRAPAMASPTPTTTSRRCSAPTASGSSRTRTARPTDAADPGLRGFALVPTTRQRFAFDSRWPGVLEITLDGRGRKVRVIEDCLNGRRTVWDDPFKPGRNGLSGLAQRIEIHSPLALVILLLGTNDLQSMHPQDAWHAAQGIATLVTAIRQAPIEPGMAIPPVLVVAPPPVQEPRGPIAPKFRGAAAKGSAWRGRTGRSRRRSAARSSTRRRSLCLRLQRGGRRAGLGV